MPLTGAVDCNVTLTDHEDRGFGLTKPIHTCKAVLVVQWLQPPETLLAEFLDTGLGAGAAAGGRDCRGLRQSGRKHIILPVQSLDNGLEATLLLSEIVLDATKDTARRQKGHYNMSRVYNRV